MSISVFKKHSGYKIAFGSGGGLDG